MKRYPFLFAPQVLSVEIFVSLYSHMRPTDISNNVIVGGHNLINPDADMIYLGLYEMYGEMWIDFYDVKTKQHIYYNEKR